MTIIIILAVILFAILLFFTIKLIKIGKTKKGKPKKIKSEKPLKRKRIWFKKEDRNKNALPLKSAYVDVVDKFLYRKELKLFVLISKVLPKGYIAFPKISLDTILEPVGKHDLFDLVKNYKMDIVVFDELSMKPKVAIDIYDGSIGDESVINYAPDVVKALEIAELPLVSYKVKNEYTQSEIQDELFKALGLTQAKDEENDE